MTLTFIAILVFLLTTYLHKQPTSADAAWYGSTGWSYRKKLVIDAGKVSGSSNLTNFPVLVSRTDTDLRDYAQSDGDDILFTSSDGQTKLDHEIETYTSASGGLIAWVEVPTLDYDDDTVIYMYYGNASATSQQNINGTWNSNYIAVWHLNETVTDEATAGTHNDSTNPSENGTQNNNDDIVGKIANAQYFDESSDYINIGDDADLDFADGVDFTITAWINATNATNEHDIVAKKNGNNLTDIGYSLYQDDTTGRIRMDIGDDSGVTDGYRVESTTGITTSGWNHIGFVWDDDSAANTEIYINGIDDNGTDTGTLANINGLGNALSFRIGSQSDSGAPFLGNLDEIRVANVALSADWIATEYNNQNDPARFFKQVSIPQGESQVTPDLAYAMDESYGTTLNSAGSNNHYGTITGALWRTEDLCIAGKCLYFDGSNDVVTTSGTSSNVRTVAFWVRPITTTEQLVDLNGSAYIESSSGTISATGFSSPTIYVNGVVSSTLVANRWQHITVTTATGISASAIRLGQISTNYGQMFMDEFQLYSSQLSATQVLSLYNSRGGNLTSVQQGAYDHKALSDGLVGYWKMDESSWTNNCSIDTANDSSGNNNHADSCPNSTGPVGGASGKYHYAGDFDGSNDYLIIPDSASTDITSSFTISAWINPDTIASGADSILDKYALTGGYWLEMASSDEISCGFFDGSSPNSITTTTSPLTTGSWQHLTCVFDDVANTLTIYRNATQIMSTAGFTTTPANADQINIGRTGGGANYTDAKIDEVRLYNRTLSAQEVQQLYTWSPGPVGYWKLDENTSTSAYDSSANDNTATLTNTPRWATGKYGASILFSGSNQHIIRADDTDFDFADDASFTLNAWIKHTPATTQEIILSKYQEAGYKLIVESDGDLTCALDYDSTWTPTDAATSTAATYDDNQWHYVSCIKTADTRLDLYIDGILIASDTSLTATNTLTNADPLYIGIDADGTSNDFTGQLDDIKIYNYARTSRQILQDMNATHPLVGTPVAGPVGHYKFDEGYSTTANDQTPNQNNLTLNTASWTNNGRLGKAWDGQGTRWLTRADDPDFDFGSSQDFSLALWVKSDSASNPASNEFLVDKQVATNNPGYRIYFNTSGQLVCDIDDDTTSYPEDSATTTQDYYDASWHHIICIRDITADRLLLYIDGNLNTQDTDLSATGDLSNTDSLTIGDSDATDNGSEFNGDIDELKIYRAALNTTDVQAEYNQGKTLVLGALSTESDGLTPSNAASREYCVPGDTATCSAPSRAQWNLDENTGTTAQDSSGNSNTGTLTSGPLWTTGKIGSAVMFDGINDRITTTNTINTSNAFTFSAWISPTVTNNNDTIFNITGTSQSLYFGSSGQLIFCNSSACYNQASSTNSALTSNRWSHLTLTYNGSDARFYVNSIDITSVRAVDDENGNSTFILGYISDNNALNGKLDQVRVYSYARTPAQIAWEFNRGAPLAWWKFDETSGTTAFDASQNGNGDSNGSVGTLNNTPTRLTTAKLNGGIDFDGTDDNISVANNTRIDQNDALAQGLAISFWVYPQSDGETDVGRIFEKNTGTYCRTTNDDATNVDLECSLDLATDATLTITDALRLNQWSHVVLGWSNDADDEITLWINGTNRGSSTNGVGNASADTATLYLGGNTTNFDGYLDEFKIFNYEPTQKQIEMVTNEGNSVRF